MVGHFTRWHPIPTQKHTKNLNEHKKHPEVQVWISLLVPVHGYTSSTSRSLSVRTKIHPLTLQSDSSPFFKEQTLRSSSSHLGGSKTICHRVSKPCFQGCPTFSKALFARQLRRARLQDCSTAFKMNSAKNSRNLLHSENSVSSAMFGCVSLFPPRPDQSDGLRATRCQLSP